MVRVRCGRAERTAELTGPLSAIDDEADLRRRVRLLVKLSERPRPTTSGRLRVGLLGGSFNPAHDGHRYVSLEALKRLELDQVWWLVSPQNPLKPRAGMAALPDRLEQARQVARHPRIKVSALEARLGTRFTADTLRRLGTWPGHRFVWLLGADNLAQLPHWRRWTEILDRTPLAVVDRQPHGHTALRGAAAARYAAARLTGDARRGLAEHAAPAWAFLRFRSHPASSTAIREGAAPPSREAPP